MKKVLLLLVFLILPLMAQDITNKLGGTSDSETYSITDSNDNVLFQVTGQGRVGIGTTAYDELFHVDGNSIFWGSIDVRNSSDNTIFKILSNGKVGVGIDSPDELFDVNGNMRLYGNFTLDGGIRDKDGELGTSGQILSSTGTKTDWINAPTGGLYNDYAKVGDVKTWFGGNFDAGAWRTRDINTVFNDDGIIVNLASNQITLAAGTYRCNIICPAHNVNQHQARLQNITSGSTLILGTSEYSPQLADPGSPVTKSFIVGRFTLAVQSVLEIQHICTTSQGISGFGVYYNFNNDMIYTVAEFWKEN